MSDIQQELELYGNVELFTQAPGESFKIARGNNQPLRHYSDIPAMLETAFRREASLLTSVFHFPTTAKLLSDVHKTDTAVFVPSIWIDFDYEPLKEEREPPHHDRYLKSVDILLSKHKRLITTLDEMEVPRNAHFGGFSGGKGLHHEIVLPAAGLFLNPSDEARTLAYRIANEILQRADILDGDSVHDDSMNSHNKPVIRVFGRYPGKTYNNLPVFVRMIPADALAAIDARGYIGMGLTPAQAKDEATRYVSAKMTALREPIAQNPMLQKLLAKVSAQATPRAAATQSFETTDALESGAPSPVRLVCLQDPTIVRLHDRWVTSKRRHKQILR
jgi:hypothetical protein